MSVAILIDFKYTGKWPFLERLASRHKVECREMVTNTPDFHKNKIGTLRRYFHYFFFPLRLVLKHPSQWECIVAWQQFYGLNYALWSRLLRKKKKLSLITMTFIYNPKGGLAGRLYRRYIKYCLTGGYIDKLVCYSPQECSSYAEHFGIAQSLFTSLPLGIDASTGDNIPTRKGNYIFSTGRSNRDYDFLVDAVADRYDLRIACPEYKPAAKEGTHRVEVLDNCFGDDMLRQMAESLCVVIPLRDTGISSGQLVVLQAMRLGKPVIVTENDTMPNYIDQGKTGFIVPKDRQQLLKTIDLIAGDDELYRRMAECQQTTFAKRFTEEALADRMSDIITRLTPVSHPR